jgi:hypothetical protein
MNPKLRKLTEQYNQACEEVENRSTEWDDLADDASEEQVTEARDALTAATEAADEAKRAIDDEQARQRAREQHQRARHVRQGRAVVPPRPLHVAVAR